MRTPSKARDGLAGSTGGRPAGRRGDGAGRGGRGWQPPGPGRARLGRIRHQRLRDTVARADPYLSAERGALAGSVPHPGAVAGALTHPGPDPGAGPVGGIGAVAGALTHPGAHPGSGALRLSRPGTRAVADPAPYPVPR